MQNDLLPDLLGSRLRAKALGWLFTHTDERFFVRQLTALLDLDSANLSRELARLEKMGLLVSTTSGKQKYYQANTKSPIFNELHSLMVKTAGVADVLCSALNPASKQIKVAFVFGSMANRTEDRASDIDLMIIGDISFGDAVDLLSAAEKTLHREINPVVYPVEELQKKINNDTHFVKSVLEGEKIFLMGDENELTDLAIEAKFKAHKTSKFEINQLLAIFDRDMADAQIVNLSTDRRFIMAYSAALTVAIAVLAASGYRAASEGHHYWTIQSLALTLETDLKTIEKLNKFRQKRNIADYERIGMASENEMGEMLDLAKKLRLDFANWLKKNHPELI
jgi:uncharacterized protein